MSIGFKQWNDSLEKIYNKIDSHGETLTDIKTEMASLKEHVKNQNGRIGKLEGREKDISNKHWELKMAGIAFIFSLIGIIITKFMS